MDNIDVTIDSIISRPSFEYLILKIALWKTVKTRTADKLAVKINTTQSVGLQFFTS